MIRLLAKNPTPSWPTTKVSQKLCFQETSHWRPRGVYITSIQQTFDRHGNLLSRVETTDFDGNGTADQTISLTQVFDRHDRLVRKVEAVDSTGDGIVDAVTTTIYVTSKV